MQYYTMHIHVGVLLLCWPTLIRDQSFQRMDGKSRVTSSDWQRNTAQDTAQDSNSAGSRAQVILARGGLGWMDVSGCVQEFRIFGITSSVSNLLDILWLSLLWSSWIILWNWGARGSVAHVLQLATLNCWLSSPDRTHSICRKQPFQIEWMWMYHKHSWTMSYNSI